MRKIYKAIREDARRRKFERQRLAKMKLQVLRMRARHAI